ncbi:alpha/beta hydrolase [Alteribacillus sp. HJP-4]|uniref:alpha/beta hydrolase n=1 Tax=Alteribacillus sp. HJP-4 TaxID=2775394 RepID=UPI0035CCEAE0
MSKFPIIKGAEPYFHHGNDIGILISHGFIGTPQSVLELACLFAEGGFTVYAPLLSGHGTDPEDLRKTSHKEWLEDIEEAYIYLQKRCKRIFVVGQSMGGTLTLALASKYKNISGIVLINPAIDIPFMEEMIKKSTETYITDDKPDIKKEGVHEITYSRIPLISVSELVTLTNIVNKFLPHVRCPAQIFHSVIDHVVPPDNASYIYRCIQSQHKSLQSLPNSYHVATMDHDLPMIAEDSLLFIKRHLHASSVHA